ncbi:galacturonic acid kinase [Prunus dulcis]|uniref:Galacturonic acid kinase n=1 Tax=Prunus dulcis TaxID=3755 RepID=A0A4Y1QLK7_PRUDU|nr:galacturonic acid kinase [Prunus dulcis]
MTLAILRSFGKMGEWSWPSEAQLNGIRQTVSEMAGRGIEDVRVVVSPYRICPLGAHIDHQGGTVSAMTINKGILLGFVPSGDTQVILRSGQFKGEARFRVDEVQCHRKNANDGSEIEIDEESDWGSYARGALYALQSRQNSLVQGIIGYIIGPEGMDSSGLSSSAAVGVAYLMALETANNLAVSPEENIEYDRLIENEFWGLRNGILDQSAILLSSYGCLLCMNCKTKEHKLIHPPKLGENHETEWQKAYKILLAFSGLKHNLTVNPGYNRRVAECQEAAAHILEPNLAKRAEHYFSENMRVSKGFEAWASGRFEDFGTLISESGLSSIQNYECGSEPLIQLRQILLRAPGVFGARFSGAGFRGCCVALVDTDHAAEAATFVREEYNKVQPELASLLNPDTAVMICEAGDCARVI